MTAFESKGLTFVAFSVVWDSERLQSSKTYRHPGKADAKADQVCSVAQGHFEKDRRPGAARHTKIHGKSNFIPHPPTFTEKRMQLIIEIRCGDVIFSL